MHDPDTSILHLQNIIKKFTQERDWEQFHDPKTSAICTSLETSELLEIFQWCSNEDSWEILESEKAKVEHELADVFFWVLEMARVCKIDLVHALEAKMKINAQNYPVEKCKGKTTKYTEL